MQTPWRTGPAAPPAPSDSLTAIATEFQVDGPLARLRFLRLAMRIAKEAVAAEGMVGMRMEADLRRGVFRTVSVWTSADAARAYAHGGLHGRSARRSATTAPKSLSRWTVAADELPLPIIAPEDAAVTAGGGDPDGGAAPPR